MDCVDENIEFDKVNERISRFVLDEMTSSEEEDFKLHLVECELCRKRTLVLSKITNLARIKGCYDRFCNAYDNLDWDEAIRLGGEMEALGYSEEMHPIKEKVEFSIFCLKSMKLLSNRNFAEVEDYLKGNSKFFIEYITVLINFGVKFLNMKDPVEAEEILKFAHKLVPNHGAVLYFLGVAFFDNKKFAEAEKTLKNSIKLKSDVPAVWSKLGRTYLENNKFFEAEENLLKAYKLQPENEYTLINLGIAYLMNKKYDEAEIFFRTAYQLLPDSVTVMCNLGLVLVGKKEFQEAEKILIKAKGLEPDNVTVLHAISLLHIEKGDIETGLKNLLDLNSKYPLDPGVCCNLAVCYYSIGNRAEAAKYIEIAHKFESSHPIIKNNYDIIIGGNSGELVSFNAYSLFPAEKESNYSPSLI